jgi:hypothetical protein
MFLFSCPENWASPSCYFIEDILSYDPVPIFYLQRKKEFIIEEDDKVIVDKFINLKLIKMGDQL